MPQLRKALAREYRPKTLAEVIGQPSVVTALTNAFTQQLLHHAYLLTGIRGVGKTTIGRIISKCLNCETGITPTPCGTCNTCTEIDTGRFPDLFEIDAASRTKVEDTRELLDNVQYLPTKGRFKIYLIDEVHMLSGHSFNALLKTLEEPPEHVKFILATTDPQKLPETVLSRCLQFHLLQIPVESIAAHLETVLQQESINPEANALRLIAKAADGSMRDALSLLDQAIAFGNNTIKHDDVKTMLGTIDTTSIEALLQALANQDANALIKTARTMGALGINFTHALQSLLESLHQITLLQCIPDHHDPEISEMLTDIAKHFDPETVQLYYQIGLMGQRDLAIAPNARIGFEMTLLRMLLFQPNQKSPAQLVSATTTASTAPSAPSAHKAPAKPATVKSTASLPPNATHQAPHKLWHEWLGSLNIVGATKALAAQCSLEEITDTHLILSLHPKHTPLYNEKCVKRIEEALAEFGKPYKVTINKSAPKSETPSERRQRETQAQQLKTEKTVMNDENVKNIVEMFDATLLKDTISEKD